MCNWRKWIWPGILTTVILTALSTWFLLETVQKDLQTKSLSALQVEHPWASVELDGRDLTLTGVAPSEEAKVAAIETTLSDNVYDVRIAKDMSQLPTIQDPFTFSAERNGDTVKLTGFYPNEKTKVDILAKAAEEIPGAKIVDELVLARGAAAGFPDLAGFALTQLGDLDAAKATISNTDYSISGTAGTSGLYSNALTAAGGALPGGGKLAASNIIPPTVSPYAWSADYSGNALTLSGAIPNEDARTTILSKAKEMVPNATITDNMNVALTAPADFSAAAAYGLEFLPDFATGKVSLSDAEFSIEGTAKSVESFTTAKGKIGSLTSGFNLAGEDIKPATVSPFTWGANYSGKEVVLSGFVPDEATRSAIISKAGTSTPDVKIVDSMKIAAGAPSGFAGTADYGLNFLPKLIEGNTSISDTGFSISGSAKTIEDYNAVIADLDSLPSGYQMVKAEINPTVVSPYTWSADFDGKVATLKGAVPNLGVKGNLVAAAQAKLPSAQVVDKMYVARTAPEGFEGAAVQSIGILPSLLSGSATISDSNVSVKGVAKSVDGYNAALASAANLPNGFKLAKKAIDAPTLTPYPWAADFDGKKIVLSGAVPNSFARNMLVDAAKTSVENIEVEDQMVLANTAPNGFLGAAKHGLSYFKNFSSGKASSNDANFSIVGYAKTASAYAAAKANVANLGSDFTMATETIIPVNVSPYAWSADSDGKKVVLAGPVPSTSVRKSIVKNAGESLPDSELIDNMYVANTAPAGFESAVAHGFDLLNQLETGKATVSDNNFSIVGVAKNVNSYNTANDTADKVPAGFKLAGKDITPPTVSPYAWNASFNGKEIVLSGAVPSEAARDAVTAKATAALPGVKVIDQMYLANTAPDGFVGTASFGIDFMPKFVSGKVGVSDAEFSVEGLAKTTDDYRSANTMASKLPAGYKLANSAITAAEISPYAWNAIYDGKSVVLGGAVPNDDVRKTITAQAKAALPKANLMDKMFIARTAPDGFSKATGHGLALLPNFVSGKASLSNTDISVEGIATTTETYNGSLAQADKVPAGFKLAGKDITPPTVSPYAWNASFNGKEIVLSGAVPSENARTVILKKSADTVPGAKIVDQMFLANKAPDGFLAATGYGIDFMPKFVSGKVGVSDAEFSVQGVAKTIPTYKSALAQAGAVPGGFKNVKKEIVPPTIKPYAITGTKSNNVITITGYAPSQKVRSDILEAAKKANPDSSVQDRMNFANAVPEGLNWAGSSQYGFSLLNKVTNGSFSIRETEFSVEGQARTFETYDMANDTVKAGIPKGLVLAKEDIRPPYVKPYLWQVTRNGNASTVSGYVPNGQAGADNIKKAKAAFGGGVKVTDQQRVADGQPVRFDSATAMATVFANRLKNSTASLSDMKMVVKGEASSEADADKIRSEIEGSLPVGYSGTHEITFPKPKPVPEPKPVIVVKTPEPKPADVVKIPEQKPAEVVKIPEPKPVVVENMPEPIDCQAIFIERMDGKEILFETNKAQIKSASFPLLDELAKVAMGCPEARIEIGGHTDSSGSEGFNQKLSERRAGSVSEYLANAGIGVSRLVAKGYGEVQPIADNGSEEGRQKNRRIEFRVIQ